MPTMRRSEKVGTVAETTGGYLRVPSGFLSLGKEHYVPLSAIRRIQHEQIQLKVSKDQLDQLEAADGDLGGEDAGAPVEPTTLSKRRSTSRTRSGARKP
jgi:hypothetical protein